MLDWQLALPWYSFSHMATILSGLPARDAIAADLCKRVSALPNPPHLAVILAGDRPDSASYVAAKRKFAERIGVRMTIEKFPETVTKEELLACISRFNNDSGVDGIIVQLPLPKGIDALPICEAVVAHKDVDGLTSHNIKNLVAGSPTIVSATARGVLNLLNFYNINVAGKHVVVVGRSLLVGKPIALSLLCVDATVTVCHRQTRDVAAITQRADIVVVAAGAPKLITKEYVRAGAVVIDVGISAQPAGVGEKPVLVGDVDEASLQTTDASYSPVPGGVGPMTVSALFQNVLDAAEASVRTV